MGGVVMTIHTFDHSYAGFSASEIQSSSCHHFFLPARRSRTLFINEAGNRHLRAVNQKRYGERWQCSTEICGGEEAMVVDLQSHSSTRMFIHKRDDPNSNSNEVSL